MKLLQSISGQRRSLHRVTGVRYFAADTEVYSKRNYASNVAEYNTVFGSLTGQRRYYLLRDAYDDMKLDGVKPNRDVFHSLAVGTLKGGRMQDANYFKDEMKAMGLVPDVSFYNFLISTCGKCKNADHAIHLFEEMKRNEVKLTGQTYIYLLNACASAGRVDYAYAIVRDMTAAGLGLNKFCYAGLIAAHKNRVPLADAAAAKIIELVEQSKGWSSVESTDAVAENVMRGVTEEEMCNIPTAQFCHRRGGFVVRSLTVYHMAFHALADIKNVEAIDTLVDMLEKDGRTPDVFILTQIMRGYLLCGDIDRALSVFENYLRAGKTPIMELFTTLIEGAMVGYTPRGMQVAQDTLVRMTDLNMFLSPNIGSDLLLRAAREQEGGYTVANYIWDLMHARNMVPTLPAVDAYHRGLKERDVPEDDPRLVLVSKVLNEVLARRGTPTA